MDLTNEETYFSMSAFARFCLKVDTKLAIRLSDYKPEQMYRRVIAMAKMANAKSFEEFFAIIEFDVRIKESFVRQLTINVTSLMRNPELFDALGREIAPTIATTNSSSVSVWSAGCANGAEAYSAAIVLQNNLSGRRFSILGTDIDKEILAKASSPAFSESEMAGVPAELRSRYFERMREGFSTPIESLRKAITFTRHDLLTDEYPAAAYDLILCRNVVIYFTESAKERVFAGLAKALRPGGILFLGCTERIAASDKLGLEAIRPFFYRRKEQEQRLAA